MTDIERTSKGTGLLRRLRHDRKGNVLAIMAASLIPLCGFAGAAIDVGRLYVVRTRLQTACDAGALAGRKFMDPASLPAVPLSGNALTQANAYFNNNFGASWGAAGWFRAGSQSATWKTFLDSNALVQVTGNAQAVVPMTVMGMFGAQSSTISVSCQASFNTPDVDVIFVLDTTASMSCQPSDDPNATCGSLVPYTLSDGTTDYYNSEPSGSKLQAVRDAVKTFYETVASNLKPGSNVRYGFVPYSSTVSAGAALYSVNPAYLASTWNFQSRHVINDYTVSSSTTTNGTPTDSTSCGQVTIASTRSPSTPLTYGGSGTATAQKGSWGNNKCTVTNYVLGPQWSYQQYNWPTSAFAATIGGGTIQDPTQAGTSPTAWQGCIDETTSNNYNNVASYNIDALSPDMNPDYIPSGSAAPTPWAPMWPDVEYGRNGQSTINGETGFYNGNTDVENGNANSTNDLNFSSTSARQSGFATCGYTAKRLQTWAETDVINYMSQLHPHGGTYHDTGMIWGLRMLSPQGVFAGDTAKWPGHADPKRVIVFLTDGTLTTYPQVYSMTGVESLDKRVRGTNTDSLTNYHNARFLAECAKAQEKNIQVWVVAVGQSLTPQLQACVGSAHPERAIGPVTSSTDLSKNFSAIATAISLLRVSQ